MSYIFALIVAALVVAADQITKFLIAANLTTSTPAIPVLGGLFNIQYTTNSGAAWSIMANKTWLLVAITLLVMSVCVYMLLKKTYGSKLMFWAVSLVLAGGLGNLIDRVLRGSVIDFIEFGLIDFPIFNVADIAVCTGAGLIILYFIVDLIRDVKEKKQKEKNSTEV